MKKLIIVNILLFISAVFGETEYWRWLKEKTKNIVEKIDTIERQLTETEIGLIGQEAEWIKSGVKILKSDKEFVSNQIEKLNEMIEKSTQTTDSWDKWKKIGKEIEKIKEKKNELEYLLTRIERLEVLIKEKVKEKKFLGKKQLSLLYIGFVGEAVQKKKEKPGTDTIIWHLGLEGGIKLPLKNWKAISLFAGLTGHEKSYFGIGITFPILPLDKEIRGSWVEPGIIISSKAIIKPKVGFNFITKTYEISLRGIFSSKDEEGFMFHVQIRKNFF